MKRVLQTILVVAVAVAFSAILAAADRVEERPSSRMPRQGETTGSESGLREARLETLWIFTADFEDLTGDNAGWTTGDISGTLGSANYWHHDTIRINGFTQLGDSEFDL